MKTYWQIVKEFSRRTGIKDPKLDLMLEQQDKHDRAIRQVKLDEPLHLGIDKGYFSGHFWWQSARDKAGSTTTTTTAVPEERDYETDPFWGIIHEKVNGLHRDFSEMYRNRIMGDFGSQPHYDVNGKWRHADEKPRALAE